MGTTNKAKILSGKRGSAVAAVRARSHALLTQKNAPKVLFKFLSNDSDAGVTRDTADKLQAALQLSSRTEVIHVALARLAKTTLPRYEMDDGAVSEKVLIAIRQRVPLKKLKNVKSSLF